MSAPALPCSQVRRTPSALIQGSRRMGLTLGALLLLLLAPVAMGATDLEVEATRNGEMIEVHARATIQAPLAVVWSTLTDYERLPEFIPGLRKSRVVTRVGATSTIEQSGEAHFLFMSIPIDITVESTE